MHRRQWLQSVAAGVPVLLAGCTTVMSSGDDPAFRTVSVDATDDSSASAFEMSVDVRQQPSADHPATVAVSMRNVGDQAKSVLFGGTPPFSVYNSGTGEDRHETPGLQLVPTVSETAGDFSVYEPHPSGHVTEDVPKVPETPRGGCWVHPYRILGTDVGKERHLEPDASISSTYSLVTYSPEETCADTGTYRFENESWGFSLRVSDP